MLILLPSQAELETWVAALKAYEEEDFEKALDLFGVRLPAATSNSPIDSPIGKIANRRVEQGLD